MLRARTDGHEAADGSLRGRAGPQAVRARRKQRGGGVAAQQRDARVREGVQHRQRRQLVVQPPAQRAERNHVTRRRGTEAAATAGGLSQREGHALVQVVRVLRRAGTQV